MNVVNILGSPRKNGNSAKMAETFCDRLLEAGASVTTHHLNSLEIKGCQGCEACKKGKESCVVQDGLKPVLDDIQAADIIVLSTPVYWGEVSAQLKCCIDRFYSFLKPDFMQGLDMHRLAPGKQLVFMQSQGAPEKSQFGDIFSRYNAFFTQLQLFENSWQVQGCGLNERDTAAGNAELLEEITSIAEDVLAKLSND